MKKNEKAVLNEEELKDVAGGGPGGSESFDACRFVHASGSTKVRQRADGRYESECGGVCRITNVTCPCHGTDNCVGRWHIVTENGSPLPGGGVHAHWYK